MRRKLPPDCSTEVSIGTVETFETLLRRLRVRARDRDRAQHDRDDERGDQPVQERHAVESGAHFDGTTDQRRARLRIDGNEPRVDGFVRNRRVVVVVAGAIELEVVVELVAVALVGCGTRSKRCFNLS